MSSTELMRPSADQGQLIERVCRTSALDRDAVWKCAQGGYRHRHGTHVLYRKFHHDHTPVCKIRGEQERGER